jgi:hypothetical protein
MVRKPDGKRLLGRTRLTYDNNIKIGIKTNMMEGRGLVSFSSG